MNNVSMVVKLSILSAQQAKELDEMRLLIIAIQDALGTTETGDALVEVARNAHKSK